MQGRLAIVKPKTKSAIIITVLVVAFIALGTLVKMPVAALGPGPTFNTLGETQMPDGSGSSDGSEGGKVPVVQITGAPVNPVSGHLDMTTVNVLTGMNFFEMVRLGFNKKWDVVPLSDIYPPGVSHEQMEQEQAAEMNQSENAAATAALHYLHLPVATYVGTVVKKGPAVGKLQRGDQIVAVNGKVTVLATDVYKALRGTKAGQTVKVSVLRKGKALTFPITLVSGAPDVVDRGLLGVGVYSAPSGKVRVHINLSDVGGPSAGLMFTLAIIDKLSPLSLTDGKYIAGTGTMDYDGSVGPIGGITHKLAGARSAGARYFLVPDKNCQEALTDVPRGLTLIRVTSVQSALDALALVRAGKTAPTCRAH